MFYINFASSYFQLLDIMVFVILFFHTRNIFQVTKKKKTQKMRLVQLMTKSQVPVQPRHRNMPVLAGVYGNIRLVHSQFWSGAMSEAWSRWIEWNEKENHNWILQKTILFPARDGISILGLG